MKPNFFRDQVVVITGASSGIGQAAALALAGQGARVVLAARREDRLESTAAECRQRGGQALALRTDVASEEDCRALVEKTIQQFGRLDMLVNNAGLAVTALFGELPNLDLFRHVLEVNFYGAVYCTYYALPYLKQSKGRLVTVSSLGGKAALPYNTPYIASKFALHGFFDSLRMELKAEGVSVTLICPSWVRTGFHEAYMDKNGVPKGAAGRAVYGKNTMTSETCAGILLKAAEKRKREVLMGPGRLAVWMNALAPGLVDWIGVNVFLKAALRRARAGQARA